jgi:pyruvate dehydrogenase E2 component (dihydrolipoamide acetyltransferase)
MADVRAAAEALEVVEVEAIPTPPQAVVPPVAPDESAAPADRAVAMRQAIGQAMARSKREIPHYYLSATVDMLQSSTWLAERNAERPVTERVLVPALFVRAVALAAREVPEMNGFYTDGAFHPGEAVHVGMAVSLRRGGLVAPALHDADRSSLDEVMADLRDLVIRARAGRLRRDEMTDPTITITNLGDSGAQAVFGVIPPPQVALVGFGALVERPWAVGGLLTVRPVVTATLSGDHRVSDGLRGAAFLGAIDRLLQDPGRLE